jgi:hypothetical protein
MKFCPHCGGNIERHLAAEAGEIMAPRFQATAATPDKVGYDQTKTWRALIERVRGRIGNPPEPGELVDTALKQRLVFPSDGTGLDTVVHLIFDRPIVPQGGLLWNAVKHDGKIEPSAESMKALGYLVTGGKIALVDDVPVSESYGVIDYWGGEAQCQRWHLTKPVTISPSRNGDPLFMDGEMIAFGARWRDDLRMRDALMALVMWFRDGVDQKAVKTVAIPLALEVISIS